MDNLDVIYVLNAPFTEQTERLAQLLPQALIYTYEEGLDYDAVSRVVLETLQQRGQALQQLTLHYIADLSKGFDLTQLGELSRVTEFLPEFTFTTNCAHLYFKERGEETNQQLHYLDSLSKDELKAYAKYYIFSSDVTSDANLTNLDDILVNMSYAVTSLADISLDVHDSLFLTTSSQLLKFSEADSIAYYRHRLIQELRERLPLQAQNFNAEAECDTNSGILLERLERHLTTNVLEPVNERFTSEVYNHRAPRRPYTPGTQVTLREAERQVLGGDFQHRFDRLFQEAIDRSVVEKKISDLLAILGDDLRELVLFAFYRFDNGLVFGNDKLLDAYCQKLSDLIKSHRESQWRLEGRISDAEDIRIVLNEDRGGWFRKPGKRIEEKVRDELVDKIFKPSEQLLAYTYQIALLENLLDTLRTYGGYGQQLLSVFDDLLGGYPLPTFPSGLEDDFEDWLAYEQRELERDIERQSPPLLRSLYQNPSSQELMREELVTVLNNLLPQGEAFDLEELLTSGGRDFQDKVIDYLERQTSYTLRTRNTYTVSESHLFLSKNSCLCPLAQQEHLIQHHWDSRDSILSFQVFNNLSIKDFWGYRHIEGESDE